MPLVGELLDRRKPAGRRFGIADVTLAPLAVGKYVLELSYEVNGQKEARRPTNSDQFP